MKTEFNKQDKKNFQAYMRGLADLLGLRDWTLVVRWGHHPEDSLDRTLPEGEVCIMSVYSMYGRKRLVVMINETDFLLQGRGDQRHYCCHELLHAHINQLYEKADEIAPLIGKIAHSLFMASMEREIEYSVDGLTDVIAPHMPLPPTF